MQFLFNFLNRKHSTQQGPKSAELSLSCGKIPLIYKRNPRARRYILRINPQREVVVTIPRGGVESKARAFVERQTQWIERQLARVQTPSPTLWKEGTSVYYRGEKHTLAAVTYQGRIHAQLGDELVDVSKAGLNWRPHVMAHLQKQARLELAVRLTHWGTTLGIAYNSLRVGNQKSRWGSCSSRGTISLNWRLIQVPDYVCDYVMIHELMHRREMNHSARFWSLVRQHCDRTEDARLWLKQHGDGVMK
ncbi:MAG: SprT family zinc-dependent metalloprotease [Verrucomicrobiota bacterium]|nr:SprT family zinc-dependent metalloprotease [Verrucomicrobiota bacterium]